MLKYISKISLVVKKTSKQLMLNMAKSNIKSKKSTIEQNYNKFYCKTLVIKKIR